MGGGIMMKKKKIHLNSTVKNIITVIVIALVFFFVGRLWPTNDNPTTITNDLLSQQILDINELATVEYNYTNMGKFENTATFYGYEIPFTTKSFIVSYDGIIKAGIDMSNIEVKVNNKKIIIKLPSATILSHEIDQDSIQIFDETKNIFNQISISDYNNFSSDQKKKMEENVIEKGLLDEAQQKAESVIRTLLLKTNDLDDSWTITFIQE